MPSYTLAELSTALHVPFEGDGSVQITGLAEINKAQKGELSFVANPKYISLIEKSQAAVLIVPTDLETEFRPVLRSPNPYLTFTNALNLFHDNKRKTSGGVHPSASIAADVDLGEDITIMANAVIEPGCKIGARTVIYPGTYIGRNVVIGEDSTFYSNVSIYDGCKLGKCTILHAGCRIGSSSGNYTGAEVPVQLEDDIELGANVVVSGDNLSSTTIGTGTKVDNLVQIGKGAKIGEHCIIVAQVTIGNHVQLGQRVTIAGQVVVSPNVHIGENARVGAKSVVEEDLPPNEAYWGVPAKPHREEKRMKANLARLPRLYKRLQEIENE